MKRYDLTVADLMSTAVITVNADEPIKEAHGEMQVGVIRHLPVVDARGRVVGVLSDRDVMRALAGKHHGKVSDIMTREVVTVQPDSQAHEAAVLMLDLKISSLPVVDDSGALVGMLTQTDFLDLAHRALLGLPLER